MVFENTGKLESKHLDLKPLLDGLFLKLNNFVEFSRTQGATESINLNPVFVELLGPELIEVLRKLLLKLTEKHEVVSNRQLIQAKTQSLVSKPLTYREKQCLDFCIQGLSAKCIAKELNISYRTVEGYLANLKKKFKCRTLRELTYKYQQKNMC